MGSLQPLIPISPQWDYLQIIKERKVSQMTFIVLLKINLYFFVPIYRMPTLFYGTMMLSCNGIVPLI
jgi:hypothetical protein